MRCVAWMAVLPLLIPLADAACGPGPAAWDSACCGGGCSCPADCSMTCDETPADLIAVPPEVPTTVVSVHEAADAPHLGVVAPPAAPTDTRADPRARKRPIFLLDCALLR